ncbi:Glycoside hydrolase family 9, partial [Dillenia turbinata]
IGDPKADHNCWERPEDTDKARRVYTVKAPNAASDVAGETAAALAAASMAFQSSDPVAHCWKMPYMQDELLWGAAWLRRDTNSDSYLSYMHNNAQTLGADENINKFGWDNKHAGLDVLVSEKFLQGSEYTLQSCKSWAGSFMCTLITVSSSPHIEFIPGGLMYRPGGSNLQHATSILFLLLVYANYLDRSPSPKKKKKILDRSSQAFDCRSIRVGSTSLREKAKKQVDYILGDNPMSLSYMVGYSNYHPQKIHRRRSSLPSIKNHPHMIGCKDGAVYFNSLDPNPNVLVGAIVGGPGEDDTYDNNRVDFRKSEPTTYINAPFVGGISIFCCKPLKIYRKGLGLKKNQQPIAFVRNRSFGGV